MKALLAARIMPQEVDGGKSVQAIAAEAKTSTRTIYRILSVSTETVSLDLADRLLTAIGEHLNSVTVLNDIE